MSKVKKKIRCGGGFVYCKKGVGYFARCVDFVGFVGSGGLQRCADFAS